MVCHPLKVRYLMFGVAITRAEQKAEFYSFFSRIWRAKYMTLLKNHNLSILVQSERNYLDRTFIITRLFTSGAWQICIIPNNKMTVIFMKIMLEKSFYVRLNDVLSNGPCKI